MVLIRLVDKGNDTQKKVTDIQRRILKKNY